MGFISFSWWFRPVVADGNLLQVSQTNEHLKTMIWLLTEADNYIHVSMDMKQDRITHKEEITFSVNTCKHLEQRILCIYLWELPHNVENVFSQGVNTHSTPPFLYLTESWSAMGMMTTCSCLNYYRPRTKHDYVYVFTDVCLLTGEEKYPSLWSHVPSWRGGGVGLPESYHRSCWEGIS